MSKDYANLSGQLIEPGVENGPGPNAGSNPNTPEFKLGRAADTFPATHFWEYGQWLDPYTLGELVRDHLMRALYGTFSNVKRMEPQEYANLEFAWMAHVAAQGEFRRYGLLRKTFFGPQASQVLSEPHAYIHMVRDPSCR